MIAEIVRKAMRRRGFVVSAWPWRACVYLASGVVVGVATLVVVVSLLAVGAVFAVLLVGLPLLVAFGLLGLPVAAVERVRARLLGDDPVPNPHSVPDRPGLVPWLRTRWSEPATWRELAYAVLLAVVLWPIDAVAVALLVVVPGALLATPLLLAVDGEEVKVLKAVLVTSGWQAVLAVLVGFVVFALAAYTTTFWAVVRLALTRSLLGGRDSELQGRVVELVRSRARLSEVFEAERRRIERDLHDGAQQRLVALGMTLGLARVATEAEIPALVVTAHEQAKAALADLRELVRGIHPRVLSDRGLPAAVEELSDRSVVPVDVDVDLPRRLPTPVESAAYFVVAEAVANIAKHSEARRAVVTGRLVDDRLVLTVRDDGVGGADPARGSGLTGLADRVAVVDGRLSLSSPPGGPTLLRLEVPCVPTVPSASSSPRTAC
ncbi:sensor histidine kinase [Saccharomonospora cyanea]|uniref:histidine kinase n=1 Tax=Saccharomonospora cyanea NA-134 TaxID=882082 RepID=H5XCY8_9PSEU|nr:sensor histidine kinase [Saccharomonospora cyanea]EHR62385.1 signal transduction histidine kinase [Saccharomonospora cyanea NA-134]